MLNIPQSFMVNSSKEQDHQQKQAVYVCMIYSVVVWKLGGAELRNRFL